MRKKGLNNNSGMEKSEDAKYIPIHTTVLN